MLSLVPPRPNPRPEAYGLPETGEEAWATGIPLARRGFARVERRLGALADRGPGPGMLRAIADVVVDLAALEFGLGMLTEVETEDVVTPQRRRAWRDRMRRIERAAFALADALRVLDPPGAQPHPDATDAEVARLARRERWAPWLWRLTTEPEAALLVRDSLRRAAANAAVGARDAENGDAAPAHGAAQDVAIYLATALEASGLRALAARTNGVFLRELARLREAGMARVRRGGADDDET